MATQFVGWKDSRGRVHHTEEDANAADEYSRKFDAVYREVDDGGNPIVRFASTSECALWIVDNWSALKKAMGED